VSGVRDTDADTDSLADAWDFDTNSFTVSASNTGGSTTEREFEGETWG
jgi:hypothetical protein